MHFLYSFMWLPGKTSGTGRSIRENAPGFTWGGHCLEHSQFMCEESMGGLISGIEPEPEFSFTTWIPRLGLYLLSYLAIPEPFLQWCLWGAKGTCQQAWGPEFNPWDPQDGREN